MKLSSLLALFQALDRAGVRYLVAGGLAVNAHGGRPADLDDVQHLRWILEEQRDDE